MLYNRFLLVTYFAYSSVYMSISISQFIPPFLLEAALVAQLVKNLPAIQDTPVPFLGQEDPLEEGMAVHSSTLAWRIPMDRGAWWATVHGVTKDSDTT